MYINYVIQSSLKEEITSQRPWLTYEEKKVSVQIVQS